MLKTVSVASSIIDEVAYDEDQQVLEVGFTSMARYRYTGVPVEVWNDLLAAPSKGSYFNRNISRSYPYEQISLPNHVS